MASGHATSQQTREGVAGAFRALRSRWRTTSLAAGWRFPNDWALSEVDAVCEAAVNEADLTGPLSRLGAARAESGAGLEETLQDLAALHAVLSDTSGVTALVAPRIEATPAKLLTVTALGWAAVVGDQAATCEAEDSLTGLTTPAYLRTRLREVYRDAEVTGRRPGDHHVLLFVSLDLSRTSGWSRLVAMALVADALRTVFAGGETLTAVGRSVVAALTPRTPELAAAAANLRWLTAEKLDVDPHLRPTGPARVWLERLPETHQAACDLLASVARS